MFIFKDPFNFPSRDGVIEATIDHHNGYVASRETADVYATQEPMQAFHQRIRLAVNIIFLWVTL